MDQGRKGTINKVTDTLPVVASVLVTILTPILTIQSHLISEKIRKFEIENEKTKMENLRKENFSNLIQKQLPNLHKNSGEAAISLASLYALAQKEEEKSILFTISITSNNHVLKETFKELLFADKNVIDCLNKDNFDNDQEDCFAKKVLEELKQSETLRNDRSGVVEKNSRELNTNSVEKEILQKLTLEQSSVNGWIYLGKVKVGSNKLEGDKTIYNDKIPPNGYEVRVLNPVNLRDSQPQGKLGNIKGGFRQNTRLKIENSSRIKIDSRYEAVWAKVTLIQN